MGSADLFEMGTERKKNQNENICFQRDSNQRHATQGQESQRFRSLGYAGLISSSVFIV